MLVPGARGNCFGMYLLCPRTLSSGRDGVGVGQGDCGCGGVCRNDLLGSGDMGVCVKLKRERNGLSGVMRIYASLAEGRIPNRVKREQEIGNRMARFSVLRRRFCCEGESLDPASRFRGEGDVRGPFVAAKS